MDPISQILQITCLVKIPTALEIDWTNFCGVFPRKDSAAAAADSLAKFELDD